MYLSVQIYLQNIREARHSIIYYFKLGFLAARQTTLFFEK